MQEAGRRGVAGMGDVAWVALDKPLGEQRQELLSIRHGWRLGRTLLVQEMLPQVVEVAGCGFRRVKLKVEAEGGNELVEVGHVWTRGAARGSIIPDAAL